MHLYGRRSRRLRRRIWLGAALAGIVGVPVVFLQPAASQTEAVDKSVRICHATSSQDNPYNVEEPAIGNNGDLKGGHLNHTGPVYPAKDWGDIIPPYAYLDASGAPQLYPGYNWSEEGQAIWENGCNPGPQPLTPIVECVEPRPTGGFLAHFGYDNPNAHSVSNPADNVFDPLSANGQQPTVFEPGRVKDAFQVESTGGDLTWHLTGNQATASTGSVRCQGSITIVKVLNPKDDPGRFNLEIDGATAGGAAAVGDGGTTGTIAVNAGQHVVGESAATGTSLSDYTFEIDCESGVDNVAEGNAPTLTVPVKGNQSVVCTITNTVKGVVTPVVPVLECVVFTNGVPDVAVWGYDNPDTFALPLAVGPANSFSPAPVDRGQPTVFEPGRLVGVFQTQFDGAATLTWRIVKKTAVANSGSKRCTATLELRKVTVPANDPGVFNLLVNDRVLATGGNGTTTGPVTVGVGEGAVRETATPGTNLGDYESTVECTRNGKIEVSVKGTKVDGAVANGDVVVCTFTNTRRGSSPTPTPSPPTPTPPTPAPPSPPPEPLPNLRVTKTASPTTVALGEKVRWTVTVTNDSVADAADVDVARVSERSYRLKRLSLTPSQGACAASSCNLGRLAPGASATITAVTEATRVGSVLNVVAVSSEEEESDYLDNTASALVRITRPVEEASAAAVKAAVANRSCNALRARPRALRAGTKSNVLATARNRFGKPLAGVRVALSGLGLHQTATTDGRGIARFSVTPPRRGLLFFGSRRVTSGAAAPCATFLAVLASPAGKPSVTG